jgi:hypothetical protein
VSIELGDDQLDRIEVGLISQQIEQGGSSRGDGLPDAGDLALSEIVHHDDVPHFQYRRQELLHQSEQYLTVDGAVDDAGRRDGVSAQNRKVRSSSSSGHAAGRL